MGVTFTDDFAREAWSRAMTAGDEKVSRALQALETSAPGQVIVGTTRLDGRLGATQPVGADGSVVKSERNIVTGVVIGLDPERLGKTQTARDGRIWDLAAAVLAHEVGHAIGLLDQDRRGGYHIAEDFQVRVQAVLGLPRGSCETPPRSV